MFYRPETLCDSHAGYAFSTYGEVAACWAQDIALVALISRHMRTGHKRLFFRHNGGTLCLSEPINGEPATIANGGTIGFKCTSPEQVKAFHDVAVAHGGTSIEDPPGLREGALGPMHLSYVRDPDGHKLCAIHRPAAT